MSVATENATRAAAAARRNAANARKEAPGDPKVEKYADRANVYAERTDEAVARGKGQAATMAAVASSQAASMAVWYAAVKSGRGIPADRSEAALQDGWPPHRVPGLRWPVEGDVWVDPSRKNAIRTGYEDEE